MLIQFVQPVAMLIHAKKCAGCAAEKSSKDADAISVAESVRNLAICCKGNVIVLII